MQGTVMMWTTFNGLTSPNHNKMNKTTDSPLACLTRQSTTKKKQHNDDDGDDDDDDDEMMHRVAVFEL
jgi:hypothetical protein